MRNATIGVGLVAAFLIAILWVVNAASQDAVYVSPVDASISAGGTELSVLVPFAGGCAKRTQFPHFELDGETLVVWVEGEAGEFSCLAGCLDEGCTETLAVRLDPPVDPTTRIIFRNPGPGSPLRVLAWIAALGFSVFVIGKMRPRRRQRPELVLYRADPEEMGAGTED